MRSVIIGLGNQGRKRLRQAGADVVATVDPVNVNASYRSIAEVPVDIYDAALVCTPDADKREVIKHCISHRKHVLVEKPLILDEWEYTKLAKLAGEYGLTCYTAYNHRFEPQIERLKQRLRAQDLGEIYLARFAYGNGTAQDVRCSPWRDQGLGVLADLGSHLLDLSRYLLGISTLQFQLWCIERVETQSPDYCTFGASGRPRLEFTTSLLSWRNSFTIDIIGSQGSAHLEGLCKWGPSTLTIRRRVFPSGCPLEESIVVTGLDRTWTAEYQYFKKMCRIGCTDLETDIWISSVLRNLWFQYKTRISA